jgi:hypothetical protein
MPNTGVGKTLTKVGTEEVASSKYHRREKRRGESSDCRDELDFSRATRRVVFEEPPTNSMQFDGRMSSQRKFLFVGDSVLYKAAQSHSPLTYLHCMNTVPRGDNSAPFPLSASMLGSLIRFPTIEQNNLESLRSLLDLSHLPRFNQIPPTFNLSVNSIPPFLPMTDVLSLLQYQSIMTLDRATGVYDHGFAYPFLDRIDPLNATLSTFRDNSVGNLPYGFPPAPLASLTQLQNMQTMSQRFSSQDGRLIAAPSLNGELNGSSLSVASTDVARPAKKPRSHKKRRNNNVDHTLTRMTLYISDDHGKLNDNLIFLRHHIEFFRATEDDILSFVRGKNKAIVSHQVGIRCCHCSHIPVGRRKKGSTYFPSNLMGIYQAAQNLSVEHLQSGLCTELPPDVKKRFSGFALGKSMASVAGKGYWAEAGRMLGLIDTDGGIRFATDFGLPS